MNRRAVIAIAAAMAGAPAPTFAAQTPETPESELPVLELRQYTLYGGKRDVLISLFEQNFISPQDALGARVLGVFRDLDDPDRFVWLRGFKDIVSRGAALTAFYGHDPAWQAHKAAANATMVDSDNVLLLRPAGPGQQVPAAGERSTRAGLVRVEIRQLRDVDPALFTAFFETTLAPRIEACGGQVLGRFVSEASPNNFPRLPIREHEPVFVWFARFDDVAAERTFSERMAALSGWRDNAPAALLPSLMRKPERLRLAPTAKSPFK